MKDTALKKKLVDLGIPAWGTRALLIRRHSEWVNLVNANCDAARPRTKRELLQDLDVWERSQGGLAGNGNGSSDGVGTVMKKDFDGAAWASNHDTDFQRLIAQARRKSAAPPSPVSGTCNYVIDPTLGEGVCSSSHMMTDQSKPAGANGKPQSHSPEHLIVSSNLKTPDVRTESENEIHLERVATPVIHVDFPS